MNDEMTAAEGELIKRLPGPPELAEIRASNIWIVEWLPTGEKTKTGRLLHDWMKQRRQGWSVHCSCGSKKEVLAAIAKLAEQTKRSELRPVLHLESHGGHMGLEGPNGHGERKKVLGEISSNRDNGHDFPLLVGLMKSGHSIMACLMPFATTSPQPRDGEVPFIR